MTLAGRIRIGMAAKGFKPSDLARRLKLPRQTVHRWLSGQIDTLRPENLFSLADALDVSARWLALRDVPPTRPQRQTEEETRVLALYKALPAKVRDSWVNSGDALLTGATEPSVISPFKR